VGALGYTIQRPTEDRFLMTREELENKMAVLLGGRAAEELAFGRLSTGAADDLVKVANIARSMVVRYGMVDSLGHLAYEEPQSPFLGEHLFPRKREYSEETAREIDVAVRDIVSRAHDKAVGILAREKPLLERGAQLLLQKETLAEAELAELRRGMGLEKAA
jgi:cell division protease FtsH